MFARDIWMRTSDMHMIYDINTKERLNYNKDIYIGEHVWLGQDVTILKGAVIGSGSVIGLGSLCISKKTQNVNSIYTGRPASLIRRDITWRHKGTNQVNEEEIECGKYDVLGDNKFIYQNEEDEKKRLSFYDGLKKSTKIDERINFFKYI